MNKVKLAKELEKELKPFCKKIKVAGSVRRKVDSPSDIDFVLIPKDKEKLEEFLEKKGMRLEGGNFESTWRIKGIRVEFYYTNLEEWGAELLAYTGPRGLSIGLRKIAKKKGLLLNNHGLFKGKKKIAGRTEREIYKALGKSYKKPENR